MFKTSLAALLATSVALAAPSRDPQNPFPTTTQDSQGAARWSTFWWADYDADGVLDVLVLHPTAAARLYRNAGSAGFEDVTREAGLAGILGARQAVWTDFDGDGLTDLFLALPDGRSRLLHNAAGVFEERTAASGLGVAAGVRFAEALDYDQDGNPDLFLATPQGERLYRNLGRLQFEEVRLELPASEQTPEVVSAGREGTAEPGPRDPAPGPQLSPAANDPGPRRRAGTGSDSLGSSGAASPPGSGQIEASIAAFCTGGVMDMAQPTVCIRASTVPTLGMLYPISSDWFVSPVGRVGLGTTNPIDRLHVTGSIRSTGQFISTVLASAPFSVLSTTKVTNLNADLLDGLDSSAFRSTSDLIQTTDIANFAVDTNQLSSGAVTASKLGNGSISDVHVASGAAIAGTKINPVFGTQNVTTMGRGGVGTNSPNTTLHVNAPSGDAPFRVQLAGASRFFVGTNGGATVGGFNDSPPDNGLYVFGDVGIGTSTPSWKLHVVGDTNSTGAYRQNGSVFMSATGLFFGRDTGWPNLAYNLGTSGLGMGSPSANNLAFQTLGIERLRITNSGRVGIGVTNPGFRLDLPNLATVEGRGRANAWTTYSSRRWKENVQTIDNALELVLRLRGVTFDWIEENGGEKDDVGFIAEEVGAVLPQLVTWEADGEHAQSLKYDRISALTVNAIHEQQAQIEELGIELENVRSERNEAERRIVELEAMVAAQDERLDRLAAALAGVLENNR